LQKGDNALELYARRLCPKAMYPKAMRPKARGARKPYARRLCALRLEGPESRVPGGMCPKASKGLTEHYPVGW
jgi:hypothetical protein